jgi:hypothetical protein
MTDPSSSKTPKRTRRTRSADRQGFYARSFTADEIRRLEARPQIQAEQELLRTKVLRLASLIRLKTINDKELNALLKLLKIVATIDALERTHVMALKGGVQADPLLESLAALDPDDL